MYLSRAELDPTRRSTMIALTSPQKFHGAVENSFSGERRRRLWRLDSLNGKLYLLLLSEELPDLTGLCAQFGTGAAPETRRYEPLLERVTPGSCWQFRLTQIRPAPGKTRRTRWRGVPEALLSGSGAGTVAAGAGREARLCPDGGRFSGDPETDLSLPEERKAAGHVAGGDL